MKPLILACCLVIAEVFDPEAAAIEAATKAWQAAEQRQRIVITSEIAAPGDWFIPNTSILAQED
jgi:hypothetical protein